MNLRRNSSIFAIALVFQSCKSRDETIVSLGVTVFIFTLVAFGLHSLLGRLAAADAVKSLLLRSKASIRALSWSSLALGIGLLVFGFSQDGVHELFSFVGISFMIIGALLPHSVDFQNQIVDFKKISLFLVCIYALLFLIFKGEVLFEL